MTDIIRTRPSGRYIPLPIVRGQGREAWRLGQLVHDHSQRPGAHRTPAAELGNDVLSHAKGKFGELAFHQWLMSRQFVPTHTPFRDDYTRKVEEDDFIVHGVRVEIKTKMRGTSSPFPPPARYNVNLGKKEIEDALHVFIELSGKVSLKDDPPALIVGWATPDHIAAIGRQIRPGMISDNGAFPFKRHDWDLSISDLFAPMNLLDAIAGGHS